MAPEAMRESFKYPSAKWLLVAAAIPLLWGKSDAQTVQSIGNTNLGNVVSASIGDTTFSVSASTGVVTKISGNGVRLSTGTTRSLVTIACNSGTCNNRQIKVTIGNVGSPTGRARSLTSFNVANGTATLGTPSGTNPLTVSSTNTIANNGTLTFWVGMNFPIAGNDSGLSTGNSTSGFYVFVCTPAATCTPTAGSTSGLAIASVWRPISLLVNSNLVFGTITRPRTGSGTVTLTPAGTRTVTGTGVFGFSSPTPSAASYTVSGEGGQVISVSVPSSFVMTRSGGGGTITVTTSNNAAATATLSSSLGNAGTYSFQAGGSFPLTSTTPVGVYTGSFNVTVQYN